MSSLRLTTVLKSAAAYAGTIPGISSGHYPAPNQLNPEDLPAVVFYRGSDLAMGHVDHDGTSQMHTPAIRASLLVARSAGDVEVDFETADDLVDTLYDAFGIDQDGRTIALERMTGLTGHVDQFLMTDDKSSLQINGAGGVFYGSFLYFFLKFHRVPDVLEYHEVTP
jgi:hypothetical protein